MCCSVDPNYFSPLRDLLFKRLEQYKVVFPPQSWKEIASEEGCRFLFANKGLKHVKVEQKNMGYYLADEAEWWGIILSAGFRGLINQLNPADQEKFKREHLQEIASLKTSKGIWLDIPVLYTTAVKKKNQGVCISEHS